MTLFILTKLSIFMMNLAAKSCVLLDKRNRKHATCLSWSSIAEALKTVDELAGLIDMSNPSIVLGTESWLDADIGDNEVFPANYVCYRKDRDCRGGGVFILVKDEINSRKLEANVGSCEAVWAQIRLRNGVCLSVSSCYRPPGSSDQMLGDFVKTIELIHTDNFVKRGDFNWPGINWSHIAALQEVGTALGKEVCKMCSSFSLSQLVSQPTRGDNILDLFLTNIPTGDYSPLVLPGISDHKGVFL